MKIAANYTVFYGEDFIEYSMRSVYPFVDYILIALGDVSWSTVNGERFGRIDRVEEKIRKFMKSEDPDHKIIIYTGKWNNDTDQRNYLLERAYGLVDYVLLTDSDDVWEKNELNKVVKFLENNEKSPDPGYAMSVGVKHFYRSLRWSHRSINNVCYVYKVAPGIRHKWIRHPGDNVAMIDIPNCYYNHFGYAYPSRIIKEKIKFWGHHTEVSDKWFENIFMKWDEGDPAYSPTRDNWSNIKKQEIIPEMSNHPLAVYKVIP